MSMAEPIAPLKEIQVQSNRAGWTDERVAMLKSLAAQGLSASQIAERLGGISRNAIIGKMTRIGIAPGRRPSNAGACKRGKRAPRVRVERKNGLNFSKLKQEPKTQGERERRAAELRARFSAVEIVDLPADESAVAVGFMELGATHCRWPLGDPREFNAMKFCGANRHGEYSYCSRHCLMAYRAAP